MPCGRAPVSVIIQNLFVFEKKQLSYGTTPAFTGSIQNHSLDFCKLDGHLLACLDVFREYHITKAARVNVANPSVFRVSL